MTDISNMSTEELIRMLPEEDLIKLLPKEEQVKVKKPKKKDSKIKQTVSGLVEGVASLGTFPGDIARITESFNPVARKAKEISETPIRVGKFDLTPLRLPTSRDVLPVLEEIGLPAQESQDPTAQMLRRGGRMVGATLGFGGAMQAARGAAIKPLALATEGAIAAGGAEAGRKLFPGSTVAEIVGSIAAPTAARAIPGLVRGL